jgi:hypothetical protein
MRVKKLTKEKNERAVKYSTSVVFLLMLFAQEQQQLVISIYSRNQYLSKQKNQDSKGLGERGREHLPT